MSKINNIRKDFFLQFGEELFKLRREHKLNLLELSQKTGIRMAKLDLMERGKAKKFGSFANCWLFITNSSK